MSEKLLGNFVLRISEKKADSAVGDNYPINSSSFMFCTYILSRVQ